MAVCCPNCGYEISGIKPDTDGNLICPKSDCNAEIPPKYFIESSKLPPVVVSALGEPGHGKTVFYSSLFFNLRNPAVSQKWPDFIFSPLDDAAIHQLYIAGKGIVERGVLPAANQQVLSRPLLFQISGTPIFRDVTLVFFDLSGESVDSSIKIRKYAHFLKRAKNIFLFISAADLGFCPEKVRSYLESMVHKYLNALASFQVQDPSLRGIERTQQLEVVFTKGDRWTDEQWKDIPETYNSFVKGPFSGLEDLPKYKKNMAKISRELGSFLNFSIQAKAFLKLVDNNFSSTNFHLVSSLGTEPKDGGHSWFHDIRPRRIFDPLLSAIPEKSFWNRIGLNWFS